MRPPRRPSVLALLFASLISAGCRCATCAEAEQNKELVRRYVEEVFNTGAVERVPEFVSPDYVEIHENAAHAIGLEGAEAHVLGVRRAFPDLAITTEQQFAEGDWVISRITVRGTHRGDFLGMAPTGAALEFTGVNVERVVGGKIVEHGGAANLFGPLLRSGSLQVVSPVSPPADG